VEKRLIARGLLAGAVAAVLAFGFARVCAEPIIGCAIAYENGRIEAENAQGVHEHGIELFTREVQANAGLGFGVLLFGLAMVHCSRWRSVWYVRVRKAMRHGYFRCSSPPPRLSRSTWCRS